MVNQLTQFGKGAVQEDCPGCLHVCHLIHSLGSGGAEQLLVEFAEAARYMGVETTVVSLMDIGESRYVDQLRSAGARVITTGLRSRWDLRAFLRTEAVLQEVRPDVIQTHLKHADLVGAWTARRLRIPMVSTLHRIEQGGGAVERLKQKAGGYARLSGAARTVAVSEAQRRWYLQTFHPDPSRVVTVHNGIGMPMTMSAMDRAAARAGLGVDPQQVVVTMLGVMRPGKGHADLLAAGRLIPSDLPIRIVMAGEGELACEIERAVRNDRLLAERVVLPGWCNDVDRLLGASDVLVHPTRDDALPTAVMHGLAAGLPVVASDVGGVPELVDDSVGVLVPPGDHHALAGALVDLIGDPDRRNVMGRAARKRYEQHFTASAWVARLAELYRQVVV